MKVTELHSWDLPYKDAVALQLNLSVRLAERPIRMGTVRAVAGVDVSAARRSPTIHAAAVVLESGTFRMLDSATASVLASTPYIPGLLSFREGPAVVAAFEKLRVRPDAVIFDGQGYAHPRRFGLAAHIGLWLKLPTVGCAKTRLLGEHSEVPEHRWGWTPLVDGGETIGAVLRTREGVKPVYVSRGHLSDLGTAIQLVIRACGRCRLPEPIRRAHSLCNEVRKAVEE